MTYIPVMSYGVGAIFPPNLISFFRQKNALSNDKAISLTDLDWAETGVMINRNNVGKSVFKEFIKITPQGKYWLDSNGLEIYRQKMKRNYKILFYGLGILCFILTIGFFINPRNIEDIVLGIFVLFCVLFFFIIGKWFSDKI